MKKVIISLCSGTGAWERPYVESGNYEVIPVTLPENDVRTWQLPDKPIYGILAAPPLYDVLSCPYTSKKATGFSGRYGSSRSVYKSHLGSTETGEAGILGVRKSDGIPAAVFRETAFYV